MSTQPPPSLRTHVHGATGHSASDRRLDRLDQVFHVVFAVVAVWSIAGLTLAEFGAYDTLALWLVAGPGAFAAGWWTRRGLRREDAGLRSVGRGGLWLAAWLVIAAALFTPPGEYVVNGGDGSVYLNIGRALERQGGLSFREPLLDRLDQADWPAILHLGGAWPRLFDLFPGGIQVETDENRVRPNFFHLLPIWIANLETIGGPRAGYYVSPLFAILAVAAIWLLAREISSPVAANVAAALLVSNFAQVWFARSPASELPAQFFVLSALYFASLGIRRASLVTGLLTGTAFGLAAFSRIDVLLLVSPMAATFLALTASARRQPGWTAAVAAFAVLTLQATAHALIISTPYTLRVLRYLVAIDWLSPISLALPPAMLALGLLCYLAYQRRTHPLLGRTIRVAFFALLGLVAIRLWPGLAGGYLTMLLTPLGVALAIAGSVLLLSTGARPHTLLIVGLLLVWTLAYVDAVREQALMPTLFRRFVPVILPLALLTTAHAVALTYARAGRLRLAALSLPLVLLVFFARQTLPVVAAAPMRGVHEQLSSVNARLPAGAVVVVDASSPSHFGLSLRYTFGRDVLHVTSGPNTAPVLGRLAASLERDGVPLVLAAGRGAGAGTLESAQLARLELTPHGAVALDFVEIEPAGDRFPSEFRRARPVIELYRATPRRPLDLPVQLEIGERDLGLAGEGFYTAEVMGTARARWTGALAQVVLPQIAAGRTPAALILNLAAPRPPGVAQPSVSVELDGEPIGVTAPVPAGFTPLELPLDAESLARLATAPAVLTLRTPSFVPREHGLNDDGRELGTVVDWIRIERR